MVIGFGKGPERFPAYKEQTPGPGAYDPKDLETKLPIKSGFLTGERFSSQELEAESSERPEPSPQRDRKQANPGTKREYSWATKKITELSKDLEVAQKRVKELEKAVRERAEKSEKLEKELAAAQENKAQLQSKLSDLDDSLSGIRVELSEATQKLAELTAQEAEASTAAREAEARAVEYHAELQEALDTRKQLEQQHAQLKHEAAEDRRNAGAVLSELTVVQQQLQEAKAESSSLRDRITLLEEQCTERSTELEEQSALRMKTEEHLASATERLTATQVELEQAKSTAADLQAAVEDSNSRAMQLLAELEAARAESTERSKVLDTVQAELEVACRKVFALTSGIESKETSLEALSSQLAALASELAELKLNHSDLRTDYAEAQHAIGQRDESIANLSTRAAELTRQLGEQMATVEGLQNDLQERRKELEVASAREQTLLAQKAELEERLQSQMAHCENQRASIVSLQQRLSSLQDELASQTASVVSTEAKLITEEALHKQHMQQLEERWVRVAELEEKTAALTATLQKQAEALASNGVTIEELRGALGLKTTEATDLGIQLAAERATLLSRAEEVSRLTQALEHRERSIAGLEAEARHRKDVMVDHEARAAALTREMQECNEVIQRLEVDTANLRGVLTDKEASISALQMQLTGLHATEKSQTDRISQLLADAERAAQTIAEGSKHINDLQAAATQSNHELTSLQKLVSELEARREELTQALDAERERSARLQHDLDNTKSSHEESNAREMTLREQLTEAVQRQSGMEETKHQLEYQVAQLKADLLAARDSHTGFVRKHEEATRMDELQRAKLTGELEKVNRENLLLREQLAAVNSDLTDKRALLATSQEEALSLRNDLRNYHLSAERQATDLSARMASLSELQRANAVLEQQLASSETARLEAVRGLSSARADLANANAYSLDLEKKLACLEVKLFEAAERRALLESTIEGLQAENRQHLDKAVADADAAASRIKSLQEELSESRQLTASMTLEHVTDMQERDEKIKGLKEMVHTATTSLTAVKAERAEAQSQLENLMRQHKQCQADVAAAHGRASQMEVEVKELRALVVPSQEEAAAAREEVYTLSMDLDLVRGQLRNYELQEQQMENLRQELEGMWSRLNDSETRNTALQNQVAVLQSNIASMTPICSKAKLNDQVLALSQALEKSHRKAAALEEQVRRNYMLDTTAALELRRLTEENEHLAARLLKMENDLKEQSGLGHNNHKQKIQYHLRLKQELEEMRHQCTVALRDKFQLEQCVRYLAVQVGMGSEENKKLLATAERKAIEKVLPACLASNALYSTPLSQKAMRLSARGKNSDQGTVYAGGKELFEEGISEARRKNLDELNSWRSEAQVAVAAVTSPTCNPGEEPKELKQQADESDTSAEPQADADGSPDKKSPVAGAAFGTPIATIRGMGTPRANAINAGCAAAATPATVAKLEDRIKQLIVDVCCPGTTRHTMVLPNVLLTSSGCVGSALDLLDPASTVTVQRGGASHRERDQDKEKVGDGSSGGGAKEVGTASNAGVISRERSMRTTTLIGGGAPNSAARTAAGPSRRGMASTSRTGAKG